MGRFLMIVVLSVSFFALHAVQAARVCVEEVAGVCLKHELRPDAGRTAAPAAVAEQALRLERNDWRAIQRSLAADGRYRGGIDGVIGPATRRAIRQWQRSAGHDPTGYLTRDQARSLLALSPSAERPVQGARTRQPVENFIIGKTFECDWRRNRIISFTRSRWDQPHPGGSFYGSWSPTDDGIRMEIYEGYFLDNGETTITYSASLEGGALILGGRRCERIAP